MMKTFKYEAYNTNNDEEIGEILHESKIDLDSTPVLPLRDMVVYPFMHLPIELGRESSIRLCEDAATEELLVLLVAQKDSSVERPGKRDLYTTGVLARIVRVLTLPDGQVTALTVVGPRARLGTLTQRKPYLRARVEIAQEILPDPDDMEAGVLMAQIAATYKRIISMYPPEAGHEELERAFDNVDSPHRRMFFAAMNNPMGIDVKQQMLECDDFIERNTLLLTELYKLENFLKLRDELNARTHEDISQQQRENFLQMQMRTIKDELGTTFDEDSDIAELRQRAAEKTWSDETRKHFDKELQKLERLNINNAEYSVQYNYLDTLLGLPWNHYSEGEVSVERVAETLDRDHYGLEKVKERILEHMAVLKLRGDMKSPILCLYGPPGVGKTSLGKSVAEALGRAYARISLGGVHDEAEIRGHRRTYIGAMPGRIMSALGKCETGNPVVVLDEIDKISADVKGDPSQALLEVLDPEQNNRFHDNFIDTDYDLSKILFIATANSLQTISKPLLDRMELVEISGYITEEKVEIARRHLVPKLLADHGFAEGEVAFDDEALREIVERYTRESGVRALEKRIAAVLRKIAVLKTTGRDWPKRVTADLVKEYLPVEQRLSESYKRPDVPGVATGLAWTSVGGETLMIETSLSPAKEHSLTLTGNLGNVMKESATLALQHLKGNAEKYGIDREVLNGNQLHLHVPEGAIPKDGPSAGITIATSMLSALTRRTVRRDLAMTGEITLLGHVMPVGGIKEKLLAAKREGVTDIILSKENRKDVEAIPALYLEGVTFHYVETFAEVVPLAFPE